MTIGQRIVHNVVTTTLVYLTMVEAKSGLVAGLIRPFMPWS